MVSRRGWLLFAAMSVIWGMPYLLIKIAVGGVPVPVLVLARVSVGAALLVPLAARRHQFAALLPYWRWLPASARHAANQGNDREGARDPGR
jgi:drug/metabolite transporter (DMT)-like permease